MVISLVLISILIFYGLIFSIVRVMVVLVLILPIFYPNIIHSNFQLFIAFLRVMLACGY